jgi:methylglutaconyl-CoA hydratase/polyketide biosynthesis enoyl-CoA hydratase PksH
MDPVRWEIEAGVAYVTLSSAAAGNMLTVSMLEGMKAAIGQATCDASCRAVAISAEGPYFCKGLDLAAAFADGGRLDRSFMDLALECLSQIRSSSLPVIACVEGDVTGGGVGLVAACDIVIAAKEASFMLSEVVVGMIPALIAPFLLRRLSPARLGYMAMSSRGICGSEAKEYGLVDELAEEGVEAARHRQLKRILRSSPGALAESKRYFEQLTGRDRAWQMDAAAEQLTAWLSRPDVVEGVRAFAEGDAPPWFQKYVTRSSI